MAFKTRDSRKNWHGEKQVQQVMIRKFIANTTLSNRQASSTATVAFVLSVIKLLECKAKELSASAAALRVAQSVLERQS